MLLSLKIKFADTLADIKILQFEEGYSFGQFLLR